METINPRHYNVQIGIDDEVFAEISKAAQPFVDDPNAVLRRKLGLDPRPQRENGRAAAKAAPEVSPPRRTGRSRQRRKTSPPPRAPKGSLTPEHEFELPILRALHRGGGELPVREVLQSVGEQMAGTLNEHDRFEDDLGVARWEKRVPFVRLRLIEHELLDSEAPRGFWRITPAGNDLLREGKLETAG